MYPNALALPIKSILLGCENTVSKQKLLPASSCSIRRFSASIDALGEWHYTLNSDLGTINGLTSGESLNDIFSVTTLDGSSQFIQVTIHGTNDKPFLSGGNRAEIDLAETSEANGELFINDPDFGQSHFRAEQTIDSNSGYGTGSISEEGHWSYTLNTDNARINSLNEGQKVFDTFNVTTADGTEQTIIIPIYGSDNPVFATNDQSSSDSIASNMNDGLSIQSVITEQADNDIDLLLSSTFDEQNPVESLSQQSNSISSFSNTESELLQQLIQSNHLDIT